MVLRSRHCHQVFVYFFHSLENGCFGKSLERQCQTLSNSILLWKGASCSCKTWDFISVVHVTSCSCETTKWWRNSKKYHHRKIENYSDVFFKSRMRHNAVRVATITTNSISSQSFLFCIIFADLCCTYTFYCMDVF